MKFFFTVLMAFLASMFWGFMGYSLILAGHIGLGFLFAAAGFLIAKIDISSED